MILGNKSHIYKYEQVSIQPTSLVSLYICLPTVCLYVAPSHLRQPHTLYHHHNFIRRPSDSVGRVPLDSEEPARWHRLLAFDKAFEEAPMSDSRYPSPSLNDIYGSNV
jgi:hypothetical protein